MADWKDLPDSALDPDAPVTSELAYAWRDNPIAIAEGAVGAPRILDAALSGVVTNAGRDWVMNRTAALVAGAIGSYVFATYTGGVSIGFGDTVSGTEIRTSNAAGAPSTATLTGQWRCLGNLSPGGGGGTGQTTLFVRIS